MPWQGKHTFQLIAFRPSPLAPPAVMVIVRFASLNATPPVVTSLSPFGIKVVPPRAKKTACVFPYSILFNECKCSLQKVV